MRFLADLHLHSRYAISTSRALNLASLHAAAQRKGLRLIGTGDFTHPAWRAEMAGQLQPAEPGLFALPPARAREADTHAPASCRGPVRFMLSGEVNLVWRQEGRARRVHVILFARDFETADALSAALAPFGRLASDGRPTLTLDAPGLMRRVLDRGERAFLIPAHVWTPHFGMLGAASAFDSVEACFGDLAPHVPALETGLSADPALFHRVRALDRYLPVSFSDAHSPDALGREATEFEAPLSFEGVLRAIRRGRGARVTATLEYFAEEGKYHLDGHRACGVRLTPAQTARRKGLCPACGKRVTLGVLNRVEALADRPAGQMPRGAPGVEHLVALRTLLGEIHHRAPNTRTVGKAYDALLAELGPELPLLRALPIEDLHVAGGERLARAVTRVREGRVRVEPGYDGCFGVVHALDD